MSREPELEKGLKEIQAQGQGVWRIDVIFPWNIPDLLLRGAEQSFRLLTMVAKAIADMPKMKPSPMCLLCDHVFTKRRPTPAAFVLLFASVDDPSCANH